ncbi:hypothetical protein ABZ341_05245 [Streptomyces sp. NPDC006173]|uniref:hypothetical protein n=1 Tax=Streptomyces sp. NPDC006173 TaxID=3155349 RepID=UPI0033EFDDDE
MIEHYRSEEDAKKAAGKFFAQSRLTLSDLAKYDVAELQLALARIDSALEDEPFAQAPSGRSRLLNRKNDVLGKIHFQANQAQIKSLRELVEGLDEKDQKERLLAELNDLETSSSSLEQESKATTDAQSDAERDAAMWKQDIMERRWEVWKSLLVRESVATLVGAALLITLGIVLITAMFMNREPSSILSNTFLIILGYFFGQSTDRATV